MNADPQPSGPNGDQPAEPERRMVRMLRVRCNECRRARAEYLANQRKGGAGLARTGGEVLVCPHYKTTWAPGFGPGSEPPDESAWETRPDGPV